MTWHQISTQGELQGIAQENMVSLGMTESCVSWSMCSQAGAAKGGQIHHHGGVSVFSPAGQLSAAIFTIWL